ncbi:MAG: carboxypeptidase regulatory-like domain-containing protein [Gemmatimonadetes bacterium]|nr:carboxypeptidase regulatory-like domain-containing protein [Gemmatimonadota bacterium]
MDGQGRKIGTEAETVSDARGEFRLSGIPAATYLLVLKAPGSRTSEYVISTRQPTLFMSTIMTRGSD